MHYKILTLLFSLTILVGCRRKDFFQEQDKLNPSITLNGSQDMDVNFGTSFVDPGATAIDGKGNALEVSINYNGFTTNKANTFSIEYSAIDGAGKTVSVTRTVNVKLQLSDIIGDYSVQSDCKYTVPSVPLPINFFKASSSIVNGGNNLLEFKNIDFAGGSDSFMCSLNNRDVTISGNLTISPIGIPTPFTYEFNGTGTISEDASSITVNYIWENVTPLIGGGIGSCVAIYNKN